MEGITGLRVLYRVSPLGSDKDVINEAFGECAIRQKGPYPSNLVFRIVLFK